MSNENSDPILILYISHIYDITFYLRLVDNLKYEKRKILLIINPKVEKQLDTRIEYLNEIAQFITSPYNLNYENGLLSNIISAFRLKRWIKNNFKINSIFITTDKSQYFSIFLFSNFKKRVLIQQVELIDKKYRFSLKYTIYFNIYHLLTSCKLMFYYEMTESKGQLVNLNFIKSVDDEVIYYTNAENIKPRFFLPRLEFRSELNKVIIFGSRYNSWEFVNKIEFKKKLFACYRTIKRLYQDKDFIYIPHPLERGSEYEEINRIFENKLQFESQSISSEYYLYKRGNALITFSIGSTSSQSSYNMGIPSKVLYKCLNFPKNIEEAYDQLFLQFPDTFFIKTYSSDNDYINLLTSDIFHNQTNLDTLVTRLNTL